MKKTYLAIAVSAAMFASASFACQQGPSCGGDVSVGVSVNGGGAISAFQAGPGTSSIQMGTIATGQISGSVGSSGYAGHNSGYLQTNADLSGSVLSATWGVSSGNAVGVNYSNANIEGDASIEAALSHEHQFQGYDLAAGSNVEGGASAGSMVELDGDDYGFALQGAAFDASNVSTARAYVREGYNCRLPAVAIVKTTTEGDTLTVAGGLVVGSAIGGSSAFAGQGGYADANAYADVVKRGYRWVKIRYRHRDHYHTRLVRKPYSTSVGGGVEVSSSVGTLEGGDLLSWSAARGEDTHLVLSTSDILLKAGAYGRLTVCDSCSASARAIGGDYKAGSADVLIEYNGVGQSWFGGQVDFSGRAGEYTAPQPAVTAAD